MATVIDSDRILVMKNGYAEEFDHPYKLLVENEGDTEITNKDGYFSKMLYATGEETANSLFEIAHAKY